MSTQFTLNTNLGYWQFDDPNWHTVFQANMLYLDGLEAIGELAVCTTEVPSTTLHVHVGQGQFYSRAGALITYAGASSVTMTASATNYLYLTDAGVLTVNTSGFPASTNIVPLATVVAGSSTITSITPARVAWESNGGAPIVFGASGGSHAVGAVPDPGSSAGTTRFLREDATWQTTPTATVFVASGVGHAQGLVPDPGGSAGTTRFLREDATWVAITTNTVFGASGGSHSTGLVPDPGSSAGVTRFLREDATWQVLVVADLPTVSLRIDSHYGAINADTDGATITFDCTVADRHSVTLGGNRTLAVANDTNGQLFTLILTQDGTGSRTVTWFSGIKWPGGTVPTLTATAGKTDVFTFLRLGSGNYLGWTVGQGH